jgi:hypothetical protein
MATTAELTKQIIVGLTNDDPVQCGLHIDPNITATEAFQLIGTLSLHILNAYYENAKSQILATTQVPEKLTKEQEAALLGIKQSMYDAFDSLVSNVLSQFYPEAPNLEIEDEAILELTNQKIEERYNQLSDEEKAAYKATYAQVLDKLHNQNNGSNSKEE